MPEAVPPARGGLFFTGTDTGVGKTLVTAGVARSLRARGRDVVVCKPVATGARPVGGRWLADDTAILAEAAGVGDDWEAVTPFAFPDPVAPPLAARRRGVALNLGIVAAAVRRRARPGGALLVEGVGGLLCPLTERETVADLVRELALPLVVVARRSLGTLNHTLLTLEAARRAAWRWRELWFPRRCRRKGWPTKRTWTSCGGWGCRCWPWCRIRPAAAGGRSRRWTPSIGGGCATRSRLRFSGRRQEREFAWRTSTSSAAIATT